MKNKSKTKFRNNQTDINDKKLNDKIQKPITYYFKNTKNSNVLLNKIPKKNVQSTIPKLFNKMEQKNKNKYDGKNQGKNQINDDSVLFRRQ
ncbi:unnamed protein product [Diatraea saccharalis]|uniref:Uncharacterized protein n=1 Tax=Diatraea saccharalis TaxID=40085 RepID=A0A9N9R1H3_9NEOP|nr:unnamed protein product [Diatraea saccharalis]